MTNKKKSGIQKRVLLGIDSLDYGKVIFGIGILVTLIAPFLTLSSSASKIVVATLGMFGVIIGFLNIRNDESVAFLISIIALVSLVLPFMQVLSQGFSLTQTQMTIIGKIYANFVFLLVPAAIVVAFKTIFVTAKDE